jgi:hypothetical protein
MSQKPRRWFQIHLSTAIVLMFVASGLLWFNFKDFYNTHWEYFAYSPEVRHMGWPVRVHFRWETDGTLGIDLQNPDEGRMSRFILNTFGTDTSGIGSISWTTFDTAHLKWWLLPNTLVAFTIISLTGLVSEQVIRRREANKP